MIVQITPKFCHFVPAYFAAGEQITPGKLHMLIYEFSTLTKHD